MSDANRTQLRYKVESSFGTAPGGTYQEIRETGETLAPTRNYITSAELRSDRQVADLVLGDVSAGGAVNVEMSYGTYDDWLAAALQHSQTWASAVTVTQSDMSADTTDNSFNSTADFGSLVEGQWIKVSGFANAENNGYFKIITKSSSSKIIVAGAAALSNETPGTPVTIYQGAYITNGTTFNTFTIEREYEDIASTFELFTGMGVSQMDINIQAGAIFTGAFTFLGKTGASATSSDASGNTAATTTDVLNAMNNVQAIYEGAPSGDVYGSLSAISLAFSLNNNLRARQQIGSTGAISLGSGTVSVTGTLSQYFASAALFNKFLADTPTSFAWIVGDAAGNRYVFEFPQVKFSTGQRPATAINTDVIAELGFTAYRDPSELITIRIARFPA